MRIAIVLCAVISCGSAHAQQVGYLITGSATVVDGDTFDLGRTRIRIWGIRAAERQAWCHVGGVRWKPAKPSAQALEDCLGSTTVTCRVQKGQRHEGKVHYVSECWRDNDKEAACMVSSGWATDWPGYSGGHYAPLEEEPKAARRGLWRCDVGPPTRRWCNGGKAVLSSRSTSRGGSAWSNPSRSPTLRQ
jgi:endonuclease YncB( thermonuclease family)